MAWIKDAKWKCSLGSTRQIDIALLLFYELILFRCFFRFLSSSKRDNASEEEWRVCRRIVLVISPKYLVIRSAASQSFVASLLRGLWVTTVVCGVGMKGGRKIFGLSRSKVDSIDSIESSIIFGFWPRKQVRSRSQTTSATTPAQL